MNWTIGAKSLKLKKKTTYYYKLYIKNHKKFLNRFIDAVFKVHYGLIIDNCAKYGFGTEELKYKIIETDHFLWGLRPVIDNIFDFEFIHEAINHSDIIEAIDNMFKEEFGWLHRKNLRLSC